MKDILVDSIVEGEIKHSRKKIELIRFKEDVVNKVKSSNYAFGKKRELLIPFKVDKDTHRKGLKLKIYRGNPDELWNIICFFRYARPKTTCKNYCFHSLTVSILFSSSTNIYPQ